MSQVSQLNSVCDQKVSSVFGKKAITVAIWTSEPRSDGCLPSSDICEQASQQERHQHAPDIEEARNSPGRQKHRKTCDKLAQVATKLPIPWSFLETCLTSQSKIANGSCLPVIFVVAGVTVGKDRSDELDLQSKPEDVGPRSLDASVCTFRHLKFSLDTDTSCSNLGTIIGNSSSNHCKAPMLDSGRKASESVYSPTSKTGSADPAGWISIGWGILAHYYEQGSGSQNVRD
ncbi:uncharacterized protein BCR38DRAFT_505523 [Pseudomassariella vexata]|uniref:Uncharacterized protein n=1 Tax=Pseudomassariella vexata TaxID=1141098 RepID=A0A1Y2DBV8_9PEZI|nr:uncharacterized protein BCR38DRAFT_505523 [Pseudomassariella vexata]ORY56155.1 hypothetical protein BCR38DRAFT_505523 [Pseudomassariella vexata]